MPENNITPESDSEKAPKTVKLYWVYPVEQLSENPVYVYGIQVKKLKNGYHVATLDEHAAATELSRTVREKFITEDDFSKFLKTIKK